LKKQLSLDNQEKQESGSTWNSISAAAKSNSIDEDKMQIKSKIA